MLQKSDKDNDTSKHDWRLCLLCVGLGKGNAQTITAALMNNPYGKFRKTKRYDYLWHTVNKVMRIEKYN